MKLVKLKDGKWFNPELVFAVASIPVNERQSQHPDGGISSWIYGSDGYMWGAQEEADEVAKILQLGPEPGS